jgi:hypothetical protein
VPRYAELQRRLLALGAGRVAPGGRLVYATCSVFVAEDEDVGPGEGWVRASSALVGAPTLDSDTLYGAVYTRA